MSFDTISNLAKEGKQFLFVISYDKTKIYVEELDKLPDNISYKINNFRNFKPPNSSIKYTLNAKIIDYKMYQKSFKKIMEHIKSGNVYLLNLTFQTPISTNLDLYNIFLHSKAKYKLFFKNEFVCFSPEMFIKIENNKIMTFPMKGTINANVPNAKEILLNNPKELSEHIMITDLMRNDLSMVATHVRVEKFRYIDKVMAGTIELYQTSSQISGLLAVDHKENLGQILDTILPAGSITGTPKKSAIDIIDYVENYRRDFYGGIFGVFDGENLYSAVMIRYIQNQNNQLFYKSGGGITLDSDCKQEYNELIEKIYMPIDGFIE